MFHLCFPLHKVTLCVLAFECSQYYYFILIQKVKSVIKHSTLTSSISQMQDTKKVTAQVKWLADSRPWIRCDNSLDVKSLLIFLSHLTLGPLKVCIEKKYQQHLIYPNNELFFYFSLLLVPNTTTENKRRFCQRLTLIFFCSLLLL